MLAVDERNKFLKEDLYHALEELFVGAIAWAAADEEKGRLELYPFQKDLSMHATFVQTRALYEFYSAKRKKKPKKGEEEDDARARLRPIVEHPQERVVLEIHG